MVIFLFGQSMISFNSSMLLILPCKCGVGNGQNVSRHSSGNALMVYLLQKVDGKYALDRQIYVLLRQF